MDKHDFHVNVDYRASIVAPSGEKLGLRRWVIGTLGNTVNTNECPSIVRWIFKQPLFEFFLFFQGNRSILYANADILYALLLHSDI